MGRPLLTDDQVLAFREKATDAAMELFVRDGYDGFSLRALAKALGCSHATPYRYFEGKAELFASVRAEGFRRFGAHLRARLEESADPLERIHILADAYFEFATTQSAAFNVIFEMNQSSDEFPFVQEAGADSWAALHEVVRDAVDAGILAGDVELLAHTMWAGVHGVATLHVAGKLRMGHEGREIIGPMTNALIRAHQRQYT